MDGKLEFFYYYYFVVPNISANNFFEMIVFLFVLTDTNQSQILRFLYQK